MLAIWFVGRLRNYLSKDHLKMMVNSFLMFLFDYCNSSIMWSSQSRNRFSCNVFRVRREKKIRPYNSCHERLAPIIIIIIMIIIIYIIIIYFRLQIYLKGRDLTCWSMWNGRKICHFRHKKGQQMYFMAVKKSRKRSSFVLYSYFNDSAFTEIRRYVYFYNKFVKEVLFSI